MQSGAFKSFVPWVGAFFLAMGVLSLFTGAPLLAVAMLCIGVAFLLLGGSAQDWPTLPPWRRIGSAAGILLGMIFLVISLFTSGF